MRQTHKNVQMSANKPYSISKSLIIQCRVIYALLMREVMTRYGRHNIGFLWLFAEPMMFTLGVFTLWTLAKIGKHGGISMAAFALTGYSSILLWRNVANRCSKAIEPNLTLMYHRNVRVIDIFLSRIILEVLGASASLITLTLVFYFFGLMNLPENLLIAMLGWLFLIWFSAALGLIIGSISERSEMLDRIWHVFTYLLFGLSGAAFMVDWLPKDFQEVVLWLPMVHATEMIRHGFWGDTIVKTHESPMYLIIVNIIFTFIGLILVRETGLRVEPE